jgi:hypothetical protein
MGVQGINSVIDGVPCQRLGVSISRNREYTRLEIKGLGEVKMHPDPDRQTLIPIREVRLIR